MGVINLSKSGSLTGSFFDEIYPSDGLVSYWTLDNSVNDIGFYGNNGTLSHGSIIFAHYTFNNANGNDVSSYLEHLTTNGLTYGPGKIGSAAYFDGTTSFGSNANIVTTNRSAQTIAAWIKVDSLASQRTVTSYNGFGTFSVKTTGSLEIELQGSNVSNTGGGRITSTGGVTVGSWFHVTAVINNAIPTNQAVDIRDADLYLNGSLLPKALTSIANNTTTSNPFFVGAYNTTTNIFSGSMDDVRIYPTVLTGSQIATIYNNGTGLETEIDDIDFTSGVFGSSLFLPMNTLVSITNNASIQFGSSNNFSFSLWAYPLSSGNKTAMGLFSRSFITGLDIGGVSGSAGNFRFGARLGGTVALSSSSNFSFGSTWYHVVGVHDATNKTVQVFVNGSASATSSFATLNWVNGGTLTIGGTNVLSGNSTGYNGYIDDVRIYNRVLGSSEIKQMYLNKPYFTSSSGVFSRGFSEAQSLSGSVKMSLNNNNSIYILGELVEK